MPSAWWWWMNVAPTLPSLHCMPELPKGNAPMAAGRATAAKIRLCWLPCHSPASAHACSSKERSTRGRVRAYVEQILAPSLIAGQIVVLDNLSVHKSARVRQLIEARGCELLFLPAYSPDYSPIEETFSKVKAFLRRVGARTHEALQEAIGQALETITAADALGWFRHCGYLPAEGRA